MFPSVSVAISVGCSNWPGSPPFTPHVVTYVIEKGGGVCACTGILACEQPPSAPAIANVIVIKRSKILLLMRAPEAPIPIFFANCLHMLILPFDRRCIARLLHPPHAGLAHLVKPLLRTPAAPILKRERRIATRHPRQFQRQFSAQVARHKRRLVTLTFHPPCKHAHLREVAWLAF